MISAPRTAKNVAEGAIIDRRTRILSLSPNFDTSKPVGAKLCALATLERDNGVAGLIFARKFHHQPCHIGFSGVDAAGLAMEFARQRVSGYAAPRQGFVQQQ
jgi:hypothetical protein